VTDRTRGNPAGATLRWPVPAASADPDASPVVVEKATRGQEPATHVRFNTEFVVGAVGSATQGAGALVQDSRAARETRGECWVVGGTPGMRDNSSE